MFKVLRHKNVFIKLYRIFQSTTMCEGDIHGHAFQYYFGTPESFWRRAPARDVSQNLYSIILCSKSQLFCGKPLKGPILFWIHRLTNHTYEGQKITKFKSYQKPEEAPARHFCVNPYPCSASCPRSSSARYRLLKQNNWFNKYLYV